MEIFRVTPPYVHRKYTKNSVLENTLIRIRTKICVLRIFFAYACHLRIFLICWMGENVKEKVDLYGALFVACLYVTNLWVQT